MIGPIRQVMRQGLTKVDQLLTLTIAALQTRTDAHLGQRAPAVCVMSEKAMEIAIQSIAPGAVPAKMPHPAHKFRNR